MITANDIVFVFSGSTGNYDPFESLGGDPSNVEIADISQNLFNSLTDSQLKTGLVDYRCFYIFNQNDTETLYDVSIYVQNITATSCLIGVNKQNDTQKITLSGPATGGNLVLSYEDQTFTVTFSVNMTTLANNFVSALNNIGLLGVTAVAEANTGYYTVTIVFEDDSGYKYHPLLELVDNNLTPATDFFISKTQNGSPINIITPKTATVLIKPENIQFASFAETQPLTLGSLRPFEGFPVWLQRTIEPGTSKSDNQTFTFKIAGKVIT